MSGGQQWSHFQMHKCRQRQTRHLHVWQSRLCCWETLAAARQRVEPVPDISLPTSPANIPTRQALLSFYLTKPRFPGSGASEVFLALFPPRIPAHAMHAQPQASSELGRAASRLTALCCPAGDELPVHRGRGENPGYLRGAAPAMGVGGRGGNGARCAPGKG